jgi:hypothetical protein
LLIKINTMKKFRIYIFSCALLVLFPGGILHAQSECEVGMQELLGFYSGKCKKGLAHGQGKAVGIDSYEGRFSKGLPHGFGIYTWANGEKYEGELSEGLAHGNGTMTYLVESGDSVVNGLWREGEYLGKAFLPPYQIIRNRGVVRYTIRKSNNASNGIRVSLFLAGNNNVDVEDFLMASDSGEEYRSGRYIGLQNAMVPYEVSITYRTWNSIHSSQSDVVFNFVINEPGTFDISITN